MSQVMETGALCSGWGPAPEAVLFLGCPCRGYCVSADGFGDPAFLGAAVGAFGLNFPGSALAVGFVFGACAITRAQKPLKVSWRVSTFDDSVDGRKQVWALS